MGRVAGVARQTARHIAWYCASLMGDNHYRRYVQHRRVSHPGEPVLSEREYWQRRHSAADENPGARCC
ncbi:MAG: YbdD/YjiX family protein [Mycobacteriaceae bacterium]|nr:YbdD/YjiX family protein [Mycobacteriaceae bacterium]